MNRKSSSIINIRLFHNWVKRELLNQSVSLLRSNNINEIALLDLAVGKGGDMQKWYDNKIYKVVGFDIDEKSIIEAKKRYGQLVHQLKRKKVHKLPQYEFHVLDLSKPFNIPKIKTILGSRLFQIISCNFAIHYFFDKFESLDTLIKIVGNFIDSGGFFIGTTMDGGKLRDLFENQNRKIVENTLFKIENQMIKLNAPYGNLYTVDLGKATDTEHYFAGNTSKEYLVDIEELKNVCKGNKLILIGTTEFQKWYNVYINNNSKNKLNDEEKAFSYLNFSFVFSAEIR
ncbi:MAG: putative mRNA cap guanine-N7 methyltransferase isoform X1 [Edafosvirus sp.]|uniref:Putative mRNA cap guanine-N7 methyltransferase isoform X1 n=1 Tax=Edafosvirus sp. TaxID=2487765 RepID=A0A3G4ZTC6_9VIRU|nr:MAG: putative mRNA cap guanine-N7 methyltransferase isoform X1 [Edafosvirus sp.]